MRYIIYSVLIFSFLLISNIEMKAQDSLIQIGENYGLIIKSRKSLKKVEDTLVYNTRKQSFSRLNGERTTLETHRTIKAFGAFAATKQLERNSLVVVLKSESKRLKQLETMSRDVKLSEVQRRNVLLKLNAVKREQQVINQALINSFTSVYDFSDVNFIYDTSITSLKNGLSQGIFTDNNGKLDESIELKDSNFYVCHYRIVSKSKQTEGLVMYNAEMEKVKAPFPTVTVSGSSGFNVFLQLLTDNDNYHQKKIERDVTKLENNLVKILRNGEIEFKKP